MAMLCRACHDFVKNFYSLRKISLQKVTLTKKDNNEDRYNDEKFSLPKNETLRKDPDEKERLREG
jgi:transcriptional regulator NrdR family protein